MDQTDPISTLHEGDKDASSTASTSDAAVEASELVGVLTCDGCEERIFDIRHKCQDCLDFDYCASCFPDAAIIHPTHTFLEMAAPSRPQASPSEDEHIAQDVSISLELGDLSLTPPTNTPECRSCYRFKYMLAWISWPLRDRPKGQFPVFLWRVTIAKLVEATQRGCSFCTFLLGRVFDDPLTMTAMLFKPKATWFTAPLEHNEERTALVHRWMEKLPVLGNEKIDLAVAPEYGVDEHDIKKMKIGLAFSEESEEEQKEKARKYGIRAPFRFRTFASAGDPASDHLASRPPNPSPKSPESIEMVRSWMRDCENNHPHCASAAASTTLPPRVLDVSGSSDSSEVRLYESAENEQGRYATLSYCWGGPQESQTTVANLQARLSSMSLAELPQTLQDAVYITKELGIQYLWIDSLCIAQDDPSDKQAQIDQMGSIYQGSVITICASREPSVTGGFFEDWASPETGMWPDLIPLKYPVLEKATASYEDAMQLPVRSGTIWLAIDEEPMSQLVPSPLSRRGWCMQEKLLSPRIMDFGRWPVWRCLAGCQHDGALSEDKNQSGELHYSKLLLTTREHDMKLDMFRTAQLYRGWYNAVEFYSRTTLGDRTDRLPAIGGIASRMSSLTGIEYLAGLWRNNLLHDLLWQSNPGEWDRRGESWLAPSWSWASVDGPILYSAITPDAEPLAQVLDCKVEPVAGSQTGFGQVSGGVVAVQGPFSEISRDFTHRIMSDQNMAPAPPKNNDLAQWHRALMHNLIMRPGGSTDLESLPSGKLFVLLAFRRDWFVRHEETIEEKCLSGLLLREIGDGEYERIGAFANQPAEGFEEEETMMWEEKMVAIV